MSVPLRKLLVSESKYDIKCPHTMVAKYFTVHNTYNDASAENEVKYMIGNDNKVSFHIAVDDKEAVQGISLGRNAYHAGDGANGTGNRESISIEICYSKSGGARFAKAESNAAELIAEMLKERGWGIDRVKTHKHWSGKNCPHRTLELGWERFLNMIETHLDQNGTTTDVEKPKPSKPSSTGYKGDSIVEYLQSVGKDSSFEARKKLAARCCIANYTGTASQNLTLLKKLRSETNTAPEISTVKYYKVFDSVSIVTGLKSIGVNSSFTFRKKIAVANGIKNYAGTATQNTTLCKLAKTGKLKKA